jgi:DNA modification methylase
MPSDEMERGASRYRIINDDARTALAGLDDGSVQTCITSPPYFGLRDYGHDGQIGLDPFTGSGTVGQVALKHGRNFIGVELNPDYLPLIHERLKVQAVML